MATDLRILVLALALAGAAFGASVRAALERAPTENDGLLTEVRAIRAELQQGIQAQLLIARLQEEEQRINNLTGRLETVRRSIATQLAGQQRMTRQLTQAERNVELGNTSPENLPGVEGNIRALKRLLAEGEQEGKQLEAQEAELTEQLATEQARWAGFNNRLDELERRLSTR